MSKVRTCVVLIGQRCVGKDHIAQMLESRSSLFRRTLDLADEPQSSDIAVFTTVRHANEMRVICDKFDRVMVVKLHASDEVRRNRGWLADLPGDVTDWDWDKEATRSAKACFRYSAPNEEPDDADKIVDKIISSTKYVEVDNTPAQILWTLFVHALFVGRTMSKSF